MTDRTVHSLDRNGFVRDWLIVGAWSEPVAELPRLLDEGGTPWGEGGRWVLTNGPDVTPLKRRLHDLRPLRADQPVPEVVEGGEVAYTGPTGVSHVDYWRRAHTAADGLVDWSEFCFTPSYRTAIAATCLEVDQAEWRTLRVASTGPVLVHVNGKLVASLVAVSYMEPIEHDVRVWLPSGTSAVAVCSWQVGFRECRQVLRMAVAGLPVRVVLPSPGADERISAVAEQLLDAVGTPRWGLTEPEVELTGPDGLALRVRRGPTEDRVLLNGGRATVKLATAEDDGGASASMLSTGELTVRVAIDHDAAPVFRELPVARLPSRRRGEASGSPEQWRDELLRHAESGPNGAAAELAAAALREDHVLRADRLDRPLWMIDNRADCADFEILGLMHLWHRVPAERWPDGLRARVRESLLGMKYWIDQPGLDAMCYFTENHQFVWHVAEYLVGQAFSGEEFTNAGRSGQRHAEHGGALAREWITRKLAGGYSEFDSNAYLAIDVFALVSLVEFAPEEDLVELAAGLLDKTLFTLACNSWRGSHVSAHGRSYVQTQRSARFEETASIMWVCWGNGALNSATLPATALATAQRYELPDAIRNAARPPEGEWLGRQHYRGDYRQHHDLLSRPYESDLLVYKTKHVMLSSVQDYRFGLPGLQEYIWGAALGPETQVYVTHAPNEATHSSARPNAWAGNRILPRVRQHRDTVLALYRIPQDDPMGYTHAWFPLSTVDDWTVSGSWIAARVDDGYLALSTQDGVRIVERGPNAYQELRAAGSGTAWVCVVGDADRDGDFTEFVGALGEPQFGDGAVGYQTRGGATLELSWDGPFTVDSRPADLDEHGVPVRPPHLENPLCQVPFGATELVLGEQRVDLRRGRPVRRG
ncbi:hypothetical protein EV193_11713 [Herbihabitans rhizosphaerae]|uniref:Uncharacterized protein n=1 Tax=Herbihabitans rhizosphaerae TaxID=1872711 RepID=A0A4Q7KBJ6_9PSEU|nr:hypothetical protein [Herbihabitans rhizosphaerae]RZS30317.1 hypothetical protein EV193_11713 [Herbihabitans rhizosphaerae]